MNAQEKEKFEELIAKLKECAGYPYYFIVVMPNCTLFADNYELDDEEEGYIWFYLKKELIARVYWKTILECY
jgi:hypothetical protein